MKLTEKELNEFPIGTKLEINYAVYIKTYNKEWIRQGTSTRFKSNYFVVDSAIIMDCIVEIPTYTEYIPPKPILDEREKEYLIAVVRPFKKVLKYIRKSSDAENEYILIALKNDTICFPDFKAGTMYKGMELDREYSLEELDI